MKSAKSLTSLLLLVQAADILLHVSTGQVEWVRILASLILAGWALVAMRQPTGRGWLALLAYLGLNGWFILQNGITNPEQGGALRIMLLVLVLISSLLAVVLIKRRK